MAKLHTNLGHPGNQTLGRAVRLAGGSDLAVKIALGWFCPTCHRIREPLNAAHVPGSIKRPTQFNESIAIDLFELADVHRRKAIFLNVVDRATGFQIVSPVVSRHPTVVLGKLLESWANWAGLPREILCDMGGEFRREFAQELESMGSDVRFAAPFSPTQNAQAERAGGAWKLHAKALCDEFSLDFRSHIPWLCMSINWAVNNALNEDGHSPAQWVTGQGLRLPYNMLSEASKLALQSRHANDRSFAQRVAMLAAAQRSIIALRYSRALSRALVARSRGEDRFTQVSARFSIGDQVSYWRGVGKYRSKSAWAGRWHGPALVIGFEGSNNVWLSHRGSTLKCSGHHVRSVLPEETIPWDDLMRDSDDAPPMTDIPADMDSALPEVVRSERLAGDHVYFDMSTAPPSPKRARSGFPPQEESGGAHAQAPAAGGGSGEFKYASADLRFDPDRGESKYKSASADLRFGSHPGSGAPQRSGAENPTPAGPPETYGPEQQRQTFAPRIQTTPGDRHRFRNLTSGDIEGLRGQGYSEEYIGWINDLERPVTSATAAASGAQAPPELTEEQQWDADMRDMFGEEYADPPDGELAEEISDEEFPSAPPAAVPPNPPYSRPATGGGTGTFEYKSAPSDLRFDPDRGESKYKSASADLRFGSHPGGSSGAENWASQGAQ